MRTAQVVFTCQKTCGGFLVLGVLVRVQKTDGHRFDTGPVKPVFEPDQFRPRRALANGPVKVRPLGNAEAQGRRHQVALQRRSQIVELGPVLAADANQIGETLGCDKCRSRAFPFQ